MPFSLTLLLQIADSAFPVGTFAYSCGLEGLARAGRFQNGEALPGYWEAYITQALSQDLPFLNSAYAAAAEGHESMRSFRSLLWEWDACGWNHGMRKASLRQGKTWLGLLSSTHPHPALEKLQAFFEAESLPTHFLPLLGYGLACLGAELKDVQSLHLYTLLRDQMSAAVRLGILGPRQAQILQARLLEQAAVLQPSYAHSRYQDAWKTVPLIEVGQGCHGFLYSRLFQN